MIHYKEIRSDIDGLRRNGYYRDKKVKGDQKLVHACIWYYFIKLRGKCNLAGLLPYRLPTNYHMTLVFEPLGCLEDQNLTLTMTNSVFRLQLCREAFYPTSCGVIQHQHGKIRRFMPSFTNLDLIQRF